MKITIVLSFILALFFIQNTALAQTYSKVKIYTDDAGLKRLSELGIPVDHGTYKQNTFFISDYSDAEIAKMQQNGFQVDILIPDVTKFYVERSKQAAEKSANTCPAGSQVENATTYPVPTHFNLGSMGGYYTYEEYLDEIDQMVAAYPNLITVKDTISNFLSHENRPIYWVKISDNPNTDEPEKQVLYTAVHHAREPESMTQLIYYMWYLLEHYGTNPEVDYLVNNIEMYFVPLVNPDGYRYNQVTNPSGGGMWRKNRRDNGDGTFGVDNNRNYSYGWNTTGTSQTTSDETYCGPSAFSEPENQAIRWFVQHHEFKFAFNYHTYGNLLLFPIGTTIAELAEHNDYFQLYTNYMVSENGYLAQKSSGLYPASGDSDDYMYKQDIGMGTKDTIFSMTPEISSDNDGFWPAINRIIPIAQENVFPNLILAHLPLVFGVVNNLDNSRVMTTSGNFNFSIRRLGLENGTITVSVNPLKGIQTVGSPVPFNLLIKELDSGMINYTLVGGIQYGDTIQYELLTDNGMWIKRDTITRTFGNSPMQFQDLANNTTHWTGTWNVTTESYYSPNQSFTDSPNQSYNSNTLKTFRLTDTVNLVGVTDAFARFYAHWDIETDYDYAAFEVSTDGGANWQQLCGKYTNLGVPQLNWMSQNVGIQPVDEPIYDGTQTDWVQEEVDLNDFIGQIIQLRFNLQSDGGVNQDGFYFDDFQLFFNADSVDRTGLEEYPSLGFNMYPNPANNSVQIQFTQKNNEGVLLITDFSGKLVKSLSLEDKSQEMNVDISDLSQGIYFIHHKTETAVSECKKLVISR